MISKDKKEQIISRFKEGEMIRYIAKEVGVSAATTSKILQISIDHHEFEKIKSENRRKSDGKGRVIPYSDHSKISSRLLNGETLQSIANEYGVTREAIRLIGKHYGVNKKEVNHNGRQARLEESKLEVMHLYKYGFPISEICKKFKINPEELNEMAEETQTPRYTCGIGKVCPALIKMQYDFGISYTGLCKKHNVSFHVIDSAFKKMGIYRKKRHRRKENFTTEECEEMVRRNENGESQAKIAESFGSLQSTISQVIRRTKKRMIENG